jgi:molybdopterin converting factor subunit 1
MMVRVRFFAAAKERIGRDAVAIELPAGATIADLRRTVAEELPSLAAILPHAMWAVDAEYATDNTTLTEQSDVALIPPVSGG